MAHNMNNDHDIEDNHQSDEPQIEKSIWTKIMDTVIDLNPFYSHDDVKLRKQSLRERDRFYILKNIESTIREVGDEEEFRLRRTCIIMTCIISIMTGLLLILWGLTVSNLFSNYHTNYALVAVGGLLILPSVAILYFIIFPRLQIRIKIKHMIEKKKIRTSPNVVSDAIKRAQMAADSERSKLSVTARLQRHLYSIKAATMGEFIETLSSYTNLPTSHMMLMYHGEVVKIHMDKTMEGGYGFLEDDVIDVFNRGGYDIMLQTNAQTHAGYRSVAGSRIEGGVSVVNWRQQEMIQANIKASSAIIIAKQAKVHPEGRI